MNPIRFKTNPALRWRAAVGQLALQSQIFKDPALEANIKALIIKLFREERQFWTRIMKNPVHRVRMAVISACSCWA